MRMVFRLQSIYLQVLSTMRNPTIQLECSPFNESKMICLGELSLNLHTLNDLCSGLQRKNRQLYPLPETEGHRKARKGDGE
ncbi:hypothetical protein LINGRAHAP2_LOCUS34763 [Linum grandiflorum]